MKKQMKGSFLIICVLLFSVLAGCGGETGDESPSQAGGNSTETWSVFFYLCGTDLESEHGAATDNIMELVHLVPGNTMNYVIQTGGTSQWQNDVISNDSLQRYIVKDNDLLLVDEQPLASMGAASTLGNFLSWGGQAYPADHYMVVFWNHGGGSISGVAFDELFDSDSLTLNELAEGLSIADVSFDIIGFDTCLMATLENAAALAPYGKYMVASEEYEPGGGWDYAVWPQYIADHSGESGETIGKVICDSYYNKCKENETQSMVTLSVVDLSKIPALVTSFDDMANEMTIATEEITSFQQLAQGALKAENYGGNTDTEGYTNMVDLGDLVTKTKTVLPSTSDRILAALQDAVKYQINGNGRSASHGLSVFFPLSVDVESCNQYVNISPSRQYLRFLETVVTDWTAPEEAVSDVPSVESVQASDYAVEMSTSVTEDGYYLLHVTSNVEAVQSVMFSLYYMDYTSGEYMLLGLDNDIDADWTNGVFFDNFRGVWPTLNGVYCAPTLIAEEDGYNLYSIPIELNGQETNLRAAYIWDDEENGHFEIYGAWDGVDNETGMSTREITQLKDGDRISPLFQSINADTGESTTYRMESFVVDGPVALKESDLQNGDYLYQYAVTDVFGRITYSDAVIMECEDGEINLIQ